MITVAPANSTARPLVSIASTTGVLDARAEREALPVSVTMNSA